MKRLIFVLGFLVCSAGYAAADDNVASKAKCVAKCRQKVSEYCHSHNKICPHKGGALAYCHRKCK